MGAAEYGLGLIAVGIAFAVGRANAKAYLRSHIQNVMPRIYASVDRRKEIRGATGLSATAYRLGFRDGVARATSEIMEELKL